LYGVVAAVDGVVPRLLAVWSVSAKNEIRAGAA